MINQPKPLSPEVREAAVAYLEACQRVIDSTREKERRLRDKALMAKPEEWPRSPFLCLVHNRDLDEFNIPLQSLMYAKTQNSVYPVNLYDIPAFGGSMTEAEFLEKQIPYDSIDAILNDWQVD